MDTDIYEMGERYGRKFLMAIRSNPGEAGLARAAVAALEELNDISQGGDDSAWKGFSAGAQAELHRKPAMARTE